MDLYEAMENIRTDAGKGKKCPGGYSIPAGKTCRGTATGIVGSAAKRAKKLGQVTKNTLLDPKNRVRVSLGAAGLAAYALNDHRMNKKLKEVRGQAADKKNEGWKKHFTEKEQARRAGGGTKAAPGQALPPASRPRLDAGQSKQCPGGYRIPADKNCGGSKTKKKVAAAGLVAGAVASGVLASKLMKKRKGTDQKMLPGSAGQKALPGSAGQKALPGSAGQKALPGGGTPQPIGGGGPQPRLGPASVARASFKETVRKREMAS